jgi:hypothetical protein
MSFGYLSTIGTVGTRCTVVRLASDSCTSRHNGDNAGKNKQMPQRGITGPVLRRSVIRIG